MSKKSGKSAASAAGGASGGGSAPRGVSFAADAVGVSLSAPEQLQRLLSLPSDSARLESLKSMWAREMPPALDAFVRHCASEMTAQCAHYVSRTGTAKRREEKMNEREVLSCIESAICSTRCNELTVARSVH